MEAVGDRTVEEDVTVDALRTEAVDVMELGRTLDVRVVEAVGEVTFRAVDAVPAVAADERVDGTAVFLTDGVVGDVALAVEVRLGVAVAREVAAVPVAVTREVVVVVPGVFEARTLAVVVVERTVEAVAVEERTVEAVAVLVGGVLVARVVAVVAVVGVLVVVVFLGAAERPAAAKEDIRFFTLGVSDMDKSEPSVKVDFQRRKKEKEI